LTVYAGAHIVIHMTERISKDQAGSLLNKSLRTVDRYIAQGKLTPIKFHNGHVELYRSEVESLLEPVNA
jgi:predicted site-specific integrase-resolvase